MKHRAWQSVVLAAAARLPLNSSDRDPTMPNPAIKGLGEIALRVRDMDVMQRFYQDVIGLELAKRFETSAFFKVADGYGGHPQVVALFDRAAEPDYSGVNPATTTVDHFAFEIDRADFAAEKQRLEQLGLTVRTTEHAWVHWRSLYVMDPEGHEVEFVCHDDTVQ